MFKKQNYKIPLDEFINHALYDPKRGYYMKKNPFGKNGDFITSPNISKIFSEMIFVWLISYWNKFYKDKEVNIVELGAGNGEMMYQIIRSSKNFNKFYKTCNFAIYEKSRKLIKLQKEKLKSEKIRWLDNLNKLKNIPTIFLGNEFLDALPIKQFFYFNKNWYEKYVQKKDSAYSFFNKKCDIKKIEKKLDLKITNNQNFLEISFEEFRIIKKLNYIVQRNGGCILFIDYAYLNYKMFDTLQAVKEHKKVDFLKEVGCSDVSHLINIPYLKKIAKKLNLDIDYTTQRDFLLNLGIIERGNILAEKKKFLDKANIFYRINRLIDKKQMGELFKVIFFHKKKEKFKLGFK